MYKSYEAFDGIFYVFVFIKLDGRKLQLYGIILKPFVVFKCYFCSSFPGNKENQKCITQSY